MGCPHCKRRQIVYKFTDIEQIVTMACDGNRCFENAKKIHQRVQKNNKRKYN